MKSIYLDTDILLDLLLDRQPFNRHAQRIFNLADTGQCKLLLSALSIANANYILRKFVPSGQRLDALAQLLAFVHLCPLSSAEIHQALSMNFRDLEDGIQYSTAVNNKADFIIISNTKDYAKSLIPVLTPEIFVNTLTL